MLLLSRPSVVTGPPQLVQAIQFGSQGDFWRIIFPVKISPGNAVIVYFYDGTASGTGGVQSISDGLNNIYTMAYPAIFGTDRPVIVGTNIRGGPTTIYVDYGEPIKNFAWGYAFEFSGIARSNALDGGMRQPQFGWPPYTIGPLTTTANNGNLIWAAGGGHPVGALLTEGPGFNVAYSFGGNLMIWAVQPVAGPVSASFETTYWAGITLPMDLIALRAAG